MANATAAPSTNFRRRRMLQWVALHSFAVSVGLLFALPFVFVVLTALMSDQQSLTRDLWPNPFAWHNLVDVWHTPGRTVCRW